MYIVVSDRTASIGGVRVRLSHWVTNWNRVGRKHIKTNKITIFGLIVVLVSLYSQIAWAQISPPVKLNSQLAMYGDVSEFQINPAGDMVVYTASQQSIGVVELFVVPVGGGMSTKLNPMMVSGGDVKRGFEISADGAFVVYIADQNQNGVDELYSVPIGGGASVKLNSNLSDQQAVFDFKISADSSQVVYRADQDTIDEVELYSVPITGGADTKLNGAMVIDGDVGRYQISADSNRVVYSADQDIVDSVELYSSPISGGGETKLNPIFTVVQQDVIKFTISPDGAFVVYMADVAIDGREEVFSVPIAGGASTKLNGVLISGGEVEDFAVSADSAWVVYRARQETLNVPSLYSNLITGGVPNELSPVFFGVNTTVHDFMISPSSDVVSFWWRGQLYKVPIQGGFGPVNLSDGLFLNATSSQFAFSSDGSSIVFIATSGGNGIFNIYTVPVSVSSPPLRLNEALSPAEDVQQFKISNDGLRVAFISDQRRNSRFELFTVDITGGSVDPVNPELPSDLGGFRVKNFSFSSDSLHIVYMADQEVDNEVELFSVAYPPPPVVDPNVFPCIPLTAKNGNVIQICL